MAGKRILITGATGVVGSAVVPCFLKEEGTEVCLLLRARSDEHLQERLSELIDYWQPECAVDEAMLARIKPLRGDVSEPLLGLGEPVYRNLAATLTHIVHSAANVKMNMTTDEARRSSVVPVVAIADLAEECRRQGQFEKLEYVSTIGVAGRMRGLVPEAPLTTAREFHNTYESSKAEAEQIIFDRMGQGLPATIHRPSMVVGDSKTGKIRDFQVFYHLCTFLSGRHTHGLLPGLRGSRLDTVPVDYVAAAIAQSSGRSDLAGGILHLCSGPDDAVELEFLREQVGRNFARHEPTRTSLSLPAWLFRAALVPLRWFSDSRSRRALSALSLLLDYLDESRVQFFAASRTRGLLSAQGLVLPTVASYIEPVLEYYLRKKSRA